MRLKSFGYPSVGDDAYTRTAGEVDAREVHTLYTDPSGTQGIGHAISRVTAIASAASRGADDANVYAAYYYNGAGRLVIEDFIKPEVKLDLADDHDEETTAGGYEGFDRFARTKMHTWYRYADGASENVDKYEYGYDYNSNRLWRRNKVAAASLELDELYHANGSGNGYDGLDRLRWFRRGELETNNYQIESGNLAFRQQFWLGAMGNWRGLNESTSDASWDLEQTRDHNKANEIDDSDSDTGGDDNGNPIEASTGTDWIDPVHDAAGNMVFIPAPGHEGVAAAAMHLVYDAWGRVAEVWVDDGDTAGTLVTGGGNPDTLIAKYEYDGLNRRVKIHVDTDAPESPDGRDTYRQFYYNAAWQVVETRSDDEDTEPEELQPEYQYVWSVRYIDAPVFRDRNDLPEGNDICDNETLYYLTDANMNVTALVQGTAGHNDLGDVVERYRYDPYGEVFTLHGETDADGQVNEWEVDTGTAPDWDNTILYAGYRHDPESGLYHVRHRYHHPTLGRWVSRDPSGYRDGMNLYEYVQSKPTGSLDPFGLAETKIIDGHPIDEWYEVTGFRYDADGRLMVDKHGEPLLCPTEIRKMEQTYWTRVETRPFQTPNNGIAAHGWTHYRDVRKCHVLVELAHTYDAKWGAVTRTRPIWPRSVWSLDLLCGRPYVVAELPQRAGIP